MGKAARRARKAAQAAAPKVLPAPFVARPFEGMRGESDWVAMRQLIPAATARLRLRDCEAVREALGGEPGEADLDVTVTTLLPASWPALHRDTGERLVALQTVAASGDASRDAAASVLAVLGAEAGSPVAQVPQATAETPRLQDICELEAPFKIEVHSGFDYWVPDPSSLDARAKAELEQANESIVPTEPMPAGSVPEGASAYWGAMGERTHIRLILTDNENAATDALARLHAAGESSLGEGTKLLGAFRADGLLILVWDLDPQAKAADYEAALADFSARYAKALATDAPLDAEQRRAKSGLLSRQLTLR